METAFMSPLQLYSPAYEQANKISVSTSSINWTQEENKMAEQKGERNLMEYLEGVGGDQGEWNLMGRLEDVGGAVGRSYKQHTLKVWMSINPDNTVSSQHQEPKG